MKPFMKYKLGQLYGDRVIQSEADRLMNAVEHFHPNDEENLVNHPPDGGSQTLIITDMQRKQRKFERNFIVLSVWKLVEEKEADYARIVITEEKPK